MNKKSTGLLLSVLGVISLVLITAGVTYAFFSYTKEGVTVNTISTGTITFLYDENEATGNGIAIENALPMSDANGMAQQGANNVFNFTITSEISGQAAIDYVVTARKDLDESTLANSQVKLYLDTDADGTNYTYDGSVVALFSDLDAPEDITLPAGVEEVVMFEGTVPAASTGQAKYSQDFDLRMWIAGANSETDLGVDYSPYEFVLKTAVTGTDALDADDLITAGTLITSETYYNGTTDQSLYERIAYVDAENGKIYTVSQKTTVTEAPEGFDDGEQYYPLNGQTFTVTVNVYANAAVVASGNGQQG